MIREIGFTLEDHLLLAIFFQAVGLHRDSVLNHGQIRSGSDDSGVSRSGGNHEYHACAWLLLLLAYASCLNVKLPARRSSLPVTR